MAHNSDSLLRPAGVTLLSDDPLPATGRDFFGFKVYADAIASLIDNEVTDTPITLAITAPWGGGKTSVAQQVRQRLAERSASRGQERPVRACWFDAWMHNDAQHLGAALAAVVARTANTHRPLWRRLLNPVPAAMLRPTERWRRRLMLVLFALIVATVVVVVDPLREGLLSLKLIDNTGAASAGTLAAYAFLALLVARNVFGIANEAARFIDNPGSEAARGSMAEVKQQLATLIDQARRRDGLFIIYVDDLERCTPERALEVCEVASQLLAHEGVVTVLVADMDAIAAAAEARFPRATDAPGEMGSRFLEKIVQIHVALPPPHPEHMRRLMRGDAPDDAFRAGAASRSADAARAEKVRARAATAAETDLSGINVAAALTGALGVAAVSAPEVELLVLAGASSLMISVLLSLIICVVLSARAFRWRRARRARRQRRIIQTAMREVLADQPTQAQFERRVLEAVDERYRELARNELQTFGLDNTPELRRVKDVIVRYPPALPRSAKRMLNHARLLTQIARDRGIFGGDPELTPEHLGEWIVLAERWPHLSRRIAARPALMAELQNAAEPATLKNLLDAHNIACPEPADDLLDLLRRTPSLSDMVARLAHLQPARRQTPRESESSGATESPDATPSSARSH